MILSFNKKAQFETKLYAVIIIVVIGIILLFFNVLNNQLYDSLGNYFNNTAKTDYSEARNVLADIQTVENSVWDYAFLAIFFGLIIQIIVFSYATRVNVVFFWLLIILDIPILILGVILSNIWQEISSNPEFAVSLARFPITNTILGTYYPTIVVILIFVAAIALFAKPSQT